MSMTDFIQIYAAYLAFASTIGAGLWAVSSVIEFFKAMANPGVIRE